ncbi:MAG: nickel pincer cofactor biosynthesis protein LarC [Butyricicoccus sp.]
MKSLYLECNMGAAGDMLMAALYELLSDEQKHRFLDKMNALGLPNVTVQADPSVKCGITGTHMTVRIHGEEEHSHDHPGHAHHEHAHEPHSDHDHAQEHHHAHHGHEHAHASHHHAGMGDITHILSHLSLSDTVRGHAEAVYQLIAEAESHAHGKPVDQIHFHEVGTLDAVADVVGVCLLMDWLAPDEILASPVHVGSGQVQCAHGVLPVPAPATAHILRGVPCYGGQVRGELCTPTGAALLKHFVTRFGEMPVMSVRQIGYGMGEKDFAAANCVRAMLGETTQPEQSVLELQCNLDDMTPEEIGFAQEVLLDSGALDVYTTPIGMKKSRPGVLLSCLCQPEDREKLVKQLFRLTTTLGIRETVCRRYTMSRSEQKLDTTYGAVRRKTAEGWGVTRCKIEYEDAARIARETGSDIRTARQILAHQRQKQQ